MLFRYRARNWPESLSPAEHERWQAYRQGRLTDPDGGGSITLKGYRKRLAEMMVDKTRSERDREILSQLADWPAELGVS